MPSWSQILYVVVLWGGLSLFGNVATQILKTPLRIFWKRKALLKGDSRALYDWTCRLIPIVVCGITGLGMHAWPEYVSSTWALILGSTAGLFSVVIYHAIKRTVPKVIGVLPEALRKRLGG